MKHFFCYLNYHYHDYTTSISFKRIKSLETWEVKRPMLQSCPQRRANIVKVETRTPKKPNSALRL